MEVTQEISDYSPDEKLVYDSHHECHVYGIKRKYMEIMQMDSYITTKIPAPSTMKKASSGLSCEYNS